MVMAAPTLEDPLCTIPPEKVPGISVEEIRISPLSTEPGKFNFYCALKPYINLPPPILKFFSLQVRYDIPMKEFNVGLFLHQIVHGLRCLTPQKLSFDGFHRADLGFCFILTRLKKCCPFADIGFYNCTFCSVHADVIKSFFKDRKIGKLELKNCTGLYIVIPITEFLEVLKTSVVANQISYTISYYQDCVGQDALFAETLVNMLLQSAKFHNLICNGITPNHIHLMNRVLNWCKLPETVLTSQRLPIDGAVTMRYNGKALERKKMLVSFKSTNPFKRYRAFDAYVTLHQRLTFVEMVKNDITYFGLEHNLDLNDAPLNQKIKIADFFHSVFVLELPNH